MYHQPGKRLSATGTESGIVISSRIRLARNLAKYPFPNRATETELHQIIDLLKKSLDQIPLMKNAYFFPLWDLSENEKILLMERCLISADLLRKQTPAAVAINQDETISIMMNEEDHLRIQVLQPGFEIHQAWEIIRHLDDELGKVVDFAYNDHFGYLTACPTNTGTGMRVSVAIHLVGLALKNELEPIIKEKLSNELTLRGFYGEGSDILGNILQISNQLTLGRTEEGILEQVGRFVNNLIEIEKETRRSLLKYKKILIEDKVFRAYAVFKHARIITSVECLELISYLRLGQELGLLKGFSLEEINHLMLLTQPAHLQKYVNKTLSSTERDLIRPKLIQEKLKLEVVN
ncbi:protein arginine kinase [candidate division KSB1 bacterium]|nr:protein arginine kinase [candidate division KSB1 bacterium]